MPESRLQTAYWPAAGYAKHLESAAGLRAPSEAYQILSAIDSQSIGSMHYRCNLYCFRSCHTILQICKSCNFLKIAISFRSGCDFEATKLSSPEQNVKVTSTREYSQICVACVADRASRLDETHISILDDRLAPTGCKFSF